MGRVDGTTSSVGRPAEHSDVRYRLETSGGTGSVSRPVGIVRAGARAWTTTTTNDDGRGGASRIADGRSAPPPSSRQRRATRPSTSAGTVKAVRTGCWGVVWTIPFNWTSRRRMDGLDRQGGVGWGAIGWTNLLRGAGSDRPAVCVFDNDARCGCPRSDTRWRAPDGFTTPGCQVVLRRRWNIDRRSWEDESVGSSYFCIQWCRARLPFLARFSTATSMARVGYAVFDLVITPVIITKYLLLYIYLFSSE